jgi:hypothetical protein
VHFSSNFWGYAWSNRASMICFGAWNVCTPTASLAVLHVDRAVALVGPHAEAGQRPSVHARWDPLAPNLLSGPLSSRHAPHTHGPAAPTMPPA